MIRYSTQPGQFSKSLRDKDIKEALVDPGSSRMKEKTDAPGGNATDPLDTEGPNDVFANEDNISN